ncbi:hypothetical protein SDJN03_10292, partial [Cucurbita argyrosperma subsp. sororia]
MSHRDLLGFARARATSLAVEAVHGRRRCNDIDEEEGDVVRGMDLLEVLNEVNSGLVGFKHHVQLDLEPLNFIHNGGQCSRHPLHAASE